MRKECLSGDKSLRRILQIKLIDGYRENPDVARFDPKETDKTISVVEKILYDTSAILQTPVPPIEFRLNPMKKEIAATTGLADNGNLKIDIDLGYFMEQTDAFTGNEQCKAVQSLKRFLGEEMYHVRVARRFPRTDRATILANRRGGKAYWFDRGERAAKRFGKRYANGTLPEKWKKRIE